ncbi:MAG: hypothetical protein KBC02_01225 [Candidatus Pacebacteria bacterium]|nr:hypothetical protein [Candidatus Paceibacterota bacterium]
MLVSPQLPRITGVPFPDLQSVWTSLPVTVELSPLVLVSLASLVGVFIAAVTVILLYHWRRFPFEHEIFKTAERVYIGGVIALGAIAGLGILFS